MTLRITDGLLILTLIGELPPDFAYAPIVIRQFLDPFDPIICHSHAHAEVESDTTLLYRSSKTCHTADILSNGKGIFIHLVDKYVGKGKIRDCIVIHALIEVVFISDKRLLQTVVPVKHTCHTVKTETIYVIFLHPVLAVGQKEIFCLILTVVEAT